jgi:Tfp pilus assembly protein PilX
MQTPFCPAPRRQHGAATLFITLVLLVVAGLVLLYTNRGAVTEQRLSANEIRGKQAFAAATAGLDHAFAYMSVNGIDQITPAGPDPITAATLTNSATGSAQTATYYQVKYCSPDPAAANPATAVTCPAAHATALAACTTPADPTDVMVVSCGWSDDDTAVHRVTQRIGGTPALTGSVPNPLISRGTANLLVGGASIFNYFNDLTVWSGGSTIGQSMTGKSFVRNTASSTYADPNASIDSNNNNNPDYRDIGNSPACSNPPAGYTCSTQGSSLGHDVIMSDTRLSQGSATDFFNMFFGSPPADYREHTSGYVVDTTSTLNASDYSSFSTTLSSIYNDGNTGLPTHQNVWVEGNVTIDGQIGTADHPVILIVNGTLDIGANAVINGVVYASGAVNSTGTPTIYGSLITGSDANTVGNLRIVYDPFDGEGLPGLGKPTKLQGSWKDW